jgi:hypothetical protein
MFHPRRGLPVLLLLITTPLPAQVSAWADIATTRASSATVDDAWGVTLAPAVRLDPTGHTTVLAGLAYGRYSGDLWALQASLDATVTPSAVGPVRPEVAVSGAAYSDHAGGPANLLALARGRLHWAGTRAGAWGGLGGGSAADAGEGRGIAFADVGAWAAAGPATLSGALAPTTIGSEGRYLDAELALRANWRRLELTAGAGRRWWREADGREDESWTSISLGIRVLDGFALTAAAGRFPSDPARGFGSGDYLQFGARVGSARAVDPEGWALRRAYRPRPPIAPPVVRAFEVRSRVAARVFVVEAPGAFRVELAGDFTDWEPMDLVRDDDGRWRLEIIVPAGTHRFNLRVDGGAWGAPPEVPTVHDDFGGVVGLLVLN